MKATLFTAFTILILAASSKFQTPSQANTQLCVCKLVAPMYPAMARTPGFQGVVHLKVDVGADGTPETVSPVERSNGLLTDAAVNAVRDWQFCNMPPDSKGTEIVVTVKFQLTDFATEIWAPTAVTFESPYTITVTTANARVIQRSGDGSKKE